MKKICRPIAQQTIGRLPRSESRLKGDLAIYGGKPLRNVRYRPWRGFQARQHFRWSNHISRAFGEVFRSRIEGLPQPLAKKFAEQWAKYSGCRFGLLLPHGTDALRLGLAAALDHDGLEYGGEVIVPNFTFIATATAALDRRFGVAFVDVDRETLLIDPFRVEEAIVPGKTVAIMPVHLFGQPANMTALKEIATRYHLKIIEDAAQAHGAAWESGNVGSLGDAAGFSFQSHKNLTSGEGGILTTNDEKIFERAYSMHNAGRSLIGGERWEHVTLGWNCRPTEYQAALLMYRFKYFEGQQKTRAENFAILRDLLKHVKCVKPVTVQPGVRRHGMHMFVMRYHPDCCGNLPFDDFLITLRGEGLPIYRAYESTVSNQPAIQTLIARHPDYFRILPTPVSDQAANDTAYIAHEVFLGNEADMKDVAAGLLKVERYYGNSPVRALNPANAPFPVTHRPSA